MEQETRQIRRFAGCLSYMNDCEMTFSVSTSDELLKTHKCNIHVKTDDKTSLLPETEEQKG